MADGQAGQRVFPGRDPARKSYGINYSTVRTGSGGTTVVKDPFRTNTGVVGSGSGEGGGESGGSSSGGSGGGGGGSGSFRSAAEDQYKANIAAALKAAQMNNPDIFGPFGSQTIEWKDGRPIITQQLNEDQQALLDLHESLGMQSGALAGEMFGEIPTSRDDITNAMMERMQPFLDRQREQQQNQLMIQGHNRGGSAWNATQDDVSRRENDARLASILAGGQEQSRMINAANALKSGVQPTIPQYPAFQGQAINPAPLFDAQVAASNEMLGLKGLNMQDSLARDQMALQQQIANQNLAAQQSANKMGGFFQIGSAAAPHIFDWAADKWF